MITKTIHRIHHIFHYTDKVSLGFTTPRAKAQLIHYITKVWFTFLLKDLVSQIISYNTTKHFINRNLERRKRPKTRILHHKGNPRTLDPLLRQEGLKNLLKQG